MGQRVQMERYKGKTVFTIANGQTVSNAQNIEGAVLMAIATPAAWTAADLQFQGSVDGTTFLPIYDDAGQRVKILSASIATSEARLYVNKALLEQLAACSWLKLESSVAQGAERILTVITKG